MRHVVILGLAALVVMAPSFAAQPQVGPSGIFSSMHLNEESGDLGGTELLVLPGPGDKPGWRVLVQISEGGGPYSELVPLEEVGDHFEFVLSADSGFPERHFSLKITAHEAILTTLPSGRAEHLRRGKSYWQ